MIVTYSSINTNSFDGYGEMVMGSKGTMIVSQEKEILLYKEAGNPITSRTTSVTVETPGKKPVLETSPSTAGPSAAASLGQPGHGRALARLPRGARALRLLRPPRQQARTTTPTASTSPDAAARSRWPTPSSRLTSNLAMRQNRRIEFDPKLVRLPVARGPRRQGEPSPSGCDRSGKWRESEAG